MTQINVLSPNKSTIFFNKENQKKLYLIIGEIKKTICINIINVSMKNIISMKEKIQGLHKKKILTNKWADLLMIIARITNNFKIEKLIFTSKKEMNHNIWIEMYQISIQIKCKTIKKETIISFRKEKKNTNFKSINVIISTINMREMIITIKTFTKDQEVEDVV